MKCQYEISWTDAKNCKGDKMQLLVNQVFIMKGQTLRVLHTAGTLVNCIDIKSEKNTFPFRLSFAELEVAFLEESAKRIDDPFLPSTTDIKEKHMSIATHRFESIKPMLDYEGLFYKNERYKILKKFFFWEIFGEVRGVLHPKTNRGIDPDEKKNVDAVII